MMYSINSRTVSINSRTASNVSKLDSSLNPRSFSRIEDRESSFECRASRDCQLTFERYCSWQFTVCALSLSHCKSESEKFLARKEKLLVWMTRRHIFLSLLRTQLPAQCFSEGHPFCSLLWKSLFLYLLRHHYIMLRCQGRVMCVLNCCWMMVLVPTCRLGTKKVIMILHVTCTCSWIFLIICILSFSSLVLFCLAVHFSL